MMLHTTALEPTSYDAVVFNFGMHDIDYSKLFPEVSKRFSVIILLSALPYGGLKLERFSFEHRKVIGFAITMPRDWLKKLAPHFHPIRSKTKTNRDSLARVFPRFASATCNYYEF